MYLHLGQAVVVRQQDIVGVFDMDNTTISRFTRSFLQNAEKNGYVEYVSMDLPRSFTVCGPARRAGRTGARRQKVYISQISPRTLQKRADAGED